MCICSTDLRNSPWWKMTFSCYLRSPWFRVPFKRTFHWVLIIPVERSFHFGHVSIFPSYSLYQWPCNKYKHCQMCCSFHIIILRLYSLKKQLLKVEWMQNGTAWRCSCSLSSLPSDVIPTGRTVWWIQLLWQLSALLTSGFEFSSEGKE